ncbi:MAG: class I SAM-dependent methyltransferase [Candidatus Lindowbacteria bacterium]|nr:class I SAM-dependent methyltransferase [Candidatus Lindowbacteria bacterium]
MSTIINRALRVLFQKLGYNPSGHLDPSETPPDFEEDFLQHYAQCKQYSMTSQQRMYALYQSVIYIEENKIPGSIVECGVWKGGSAMLCAAILKKRGSTSRDIYLYDTFQGMPKPSNIDVSHDGQKAIPQWEEMQKNDYNEWCYAKVQEVKTNMESTGYPKEKLHYVQGKVEDTLPEVLPNKISILRLDTDWYESTYHELEHLYPRLVKNGILILDDYGHWTGAKNAVQQYFKEKGIHCLLNRVDYTCRITTKVEHSE